MRRAARVRTGRMGIAPRARAFPTVDPDPTRWLNRRRRPHLYQNSYPPHAASRGSIRIRGDPLIISVTRVKLQLRTGPSVTSRRGINFMIGSAFSSTRDKSTRDKSTRDVLIEVFDGRHRRPS